MRDGLVSVSYTHLKSRFADDFIKLPTLSDDIHRKKDAEGVPGFIVMETVPVSYTHLDVYKRQG